MRQQPLYQPLPRKRARQANHQGRVIKIGITILLAVLIIPPVWMTNTIQYLGYVIGSFK
ncbi:hypothetical protein J9253_06050 [Thiothrix litoralis]|uniref:Uncharacterized protein n=1 Tax=Thiothrix litoralis TaxID=2891210 RepID=A0ABX7WV42_9GAMM|nr:hypothetical protein [Thiothrix litoralis]QTR47495.1 hypothetical protein J9253_06050 [Thiothrix litoralis]